MTWELKHSRKQTPGVPPAKRSTSQVPPAPPSLPPQPELEGDEPTMTVFQAMGVGENGQGIFEDAPERFPGEMERDLMMNYGWMPERSWQMWKRLMFRDTEAV